MVCVLVVQDEDWTALHAAADNGHVAVVKALLAAGADVTATTVCGDVPYVGAGTVSIEHDLMECSW
jgi:ankyrin repeat protein